MAEKVFGEGERQGFSDAKSGLDQNWPAAANHLILGKVVRVVDMFINGVSGLFFFSFLQRISKHCGISGNVMRRLKRTKDRCEILSF